MKPLSDTQRTILKGYIDDPNIDIEQIHFLAGGNVSENSLTVVYEMTQDDKRYRDWDIIDTDGRTTETHSVEVNMPVAS